MVDLVSPAKHSETTIEEVLNYVRAIFSEGCPAEGSGETNQGRDHWRNVGSDHLARWSASTGRLAVELFLSHGQSIAPGFFRVWGITRTPSVELALRLRTRSIRVIAT